MSNADNDDSTEPSTEEPVLGSISRALKLVEERTRILAGSLAGEDDTLMKRVALVLNHFPDTRDSDIRLQLRYWRLFEHWDGGPIHDEDLLAFARLTSIARSRARIQNQLGLFQPSLTVKQRRGTLEEDERELARDAPPRSPSLTVFADESGKTATNLIVGGVWFGDVSEVLALDRILSNWRKTTGFYSELHFKDLKDQNEIRYQEAIDLVMANASSISFKALYIPREGVGNIEEALDKLFYYLLIRGVEHEHKTGRSPLPRVVEFWKDQEERSKDLLRLAGLRDRINQAGKTIFGGKLRGGDFEAVPSEKIDLMQIADLFIGAIGRRINTPSLVPKAKDRFSKYLLSLVGLPDGPENAQGSGDFAIATNF